MLPEELGQSSQLDSYHCEVDPRFGTGFALFIITHQASVAHQPTERSFHDPTPGQHFESLHIIGSLDDFDLELRSQLLHPLREIRAAVASVDPQPAQPQVNQHRTRPWAN